VTGKEKLKKVNTYAVCYGAGREKDLIKFDMVIVEPGFYDETAISRLQDAGVIVIAYVSVIEMHKSHTLRSLLKEEDYLVIEGKRIFNEEYKTDLIDLRSKRWKSILVHQIGNLILNYKYDGIFLDTIGDIEFDTIPPHHQDLLISSAVNFIREIRSLFKDCIIIQNNGLEKVFTATSDFIDGLCWENPPLDKEECRKWVSATVKQLTYLHQNRDVKILVLLEEHENNAVTKDEVLHLEAEKLSITNNFILYKAPYRYVGDVIFKI
jgi:polysaccharide biosynthesis protein PelA